MLRIVCPRCKYVIHYFDDLCQDALSCPGCGDPIPTEAPAARQPPPAAPPLEARQRAVDPPRTDPWPRPVSADRAAPAAPPRRASQGAGGASIDLSSPKTINHVLKAMIFGVLALFPLSTTCALLLGRDFGASPLFLGVFLVGWVLLAGCLRNLHALRAQPHFRLLPEGIHLRYWKSVGFPSLAMFRPAYAMVECVIPWSEFVQCRTYSHSTNGSTDWQELIIETGARSHHLGWDIFEASVHQLQEAILNFREVEFRQPVRHVLNVAEFCRLRFHTPLRVVAQGGSSSGGVLTVGVLFVLALVAVCGIAPRVLPGGLHWLGIPLVLVLGVALVVTLLNQGTGMRGQRVLELSAEGLRLGETGEALRLIAWEEIHFTRISELTTNGAPCKTLQIHLHDRSLITLTEGYTRSLEDLNELLDPPLGKVQEAYQRLAAGEDVETAAVGAGLPRSDWGAAV